MTTRECVHLVTGSYSRSRNKDGGHAMRSVENAMLHAHFITALSSVCYRRRVIGDGIFTLRECGFVLARRFPLRILDGCRPFLLL